MENGTDGILVLGTTGESSTMTHEEDDAVVECTLQTIRKNSCYCRQRLQLYKLPSKEQKYAAMGADALLVISPYYNKANAQGMIAHFTAVADAVDKPIILYNVPGRTGCSISEEAVKVLSKHPNICGIKEASGNIAYAAAIARYLSDDFVMFSGNDDMVIPLLSLGGSGVISVWANIMPKEVHEMVHNYLNGNTEAALATQLHYLDLIHALFIEVNPIPVKEALNMMGKAVGGYRLPLCEMEETHRKALLHEMKEAGLC
ncbi:MAG: 4-hydroxy-tetrahydrodipicolinate synthase [[Clostridium] innocuum]